MVLHILRTQIKFFILALILFKTTAIFAQEFHIHSINTDNYPVIEADFTAYNKEQAKIYNSTVQDFFIQENNQENKIIEVTNLELNYQPVSIVFMIDVSLSMSGQRIRLVKEGLTRFIEQIPLETSEIAVACFSNETYVYSDYTRNLHRISLALNSLQTVNGTDFNKAFLDPVQGALALSSKGSNKKVIIFVTDGLGETDAEQIGAQAKDMDASVFALNLHLSIPEDLKRLSVNTGGLYFEKIRTEAEFTNASIAIFQKLRCTDFGKVKWLSKLDCTPDREVSLEYRKQKIDFNYDVPKNMVGKIEINPSQILFGAGKPGTEQTQRLNIITHHIPVSLLGIKMDTSSAFAIVDTLKFPVTLQPEAPIDLSIKFKAPDAGIFNTQLKVSFKECPETNVTLLAGGEEQIKLLFPVGGEIFTVENDTTILWEGVKKSQNVAVSFKLHQGDPWQILGRAKDLRYKWPLPADTSNNASIRLTPIASVDENMEITRTLDGGKSQLQNIFFSPTGDRLVTTDKDAFVKTWNPDSGTIITSLGGYAAEKAIINPTNQLLMMFLKDEAITWNLNEDKLVNRTSNIAKKVSTSFILPSGEERPIAGNLTMDQAKNVRIWSTLNSSKLFLFKQPDLKWASFTYDGKYALALDSKNTIQIIQSDSGRIIHQIPFKEPITEVILSPSDYMAAVRIPNGLSILDVATGKEIYRIPEVEYKQFSPGGKFLILKISDSSRSMSIADINTGKTIMSLAGVKAYKFSENSEYLMLNKQDTLKLWSFADHKFVLNLSHKSIRQIVFNTEATKAFVITSTNAMEIYETSTGNLTGTIAEFSRKVKDVALNPSKQQLAILTEDNRVEIWSEGKPKEMKEAVSGSFSIVSPKPVVMDTIRFGIQRVNDPTDMSIDKFIVNPTPFSITVRKIEIKGKDAVAFDISNKEFPRKILAKSTDAEEFRFYPRNIGLFEAVAYTYTATDTFKTVLLGQGQLSSLKYLIKHLDFGPVKVGMRKDTLASLLVNEGTDTLKISGITNFGPDEDQFKVQLNKAIVIVPGDTLKLPVCFTPVRRGKTTTLLIPEQIPGNDKIIVRGEGLAPREVWVKGVTRNSNDSVPLPARVVCTDLMVQRNLTEVSTGPDGKFSIKLHADRNFGISAEKENYISTSLNIDLSENVPADTIYKDLYLTEIKPGAMIRLNCIFFEIGKANLLPESESDLKRMLEIIRNHPKMYFEIHGHTDAMGNDAYNLNLSKARATMVMNYLIKNGAGKDKLSIRFFGESKPVADNATDEGRTLNRRVEMKVVK